MNIIITGGAGFIGAHLASRLTKQRHTVKVIDNLSIGNLDNLKSIKSKIAFVKGDVRNLTLLVRAFQGYDAVFHLAAISSIQKTIKHPKLCHAVNVTGTFNVLEAARANKIKKVVFASSCAVYGEVKIKGKISETTPAIPQSPYALSKLVSEHYCDVYAKRYGLPTISLRYFNVYGMGQTVKNDYSAVIPKFVATLVKGSSPIIYGSGNQTRDFIFIDDVIAANTLVLSTPQPLSGEVINIGTGKATSIRLLLAAIQRLTRTRHIKPTHEPEMQGDITFSVADITRAKKLLGYTPKTTLKAGLKRYLEK